VTAPAPAAAGHSFMVLAYKDSPFLEGCIRSLQAQTTPSRIVVATSTPCAAIERAVAATGVELTVNPDRAGIGGDWNFALAAAGTRYVTLAHQDDTYDPEFAAATLALFARYPDGAVCFTGYQEIDDAGRAKSSKISRVKHLIEAVTLGTRTRVQGSPLRLFLSFGNPLPCSSVTFDREALAGFSFDEAFASNLDWDAWWRLYEEGRVFLRAPGRLVGRRHNDLTETARLIQDGRRQAEDAAMFGRIWPRPVDRAIAALYALSYRSLPSVVRFGLVGGVTTLAAYLVFIGLFDMGLHHQAANVCSWAVGVVIGYLLNRSFTFAVAKPIGLVELLLYLGCYVLQYLLGAAGLALWMDRLHFGPTLAFVCNLVITTAFSFLFMRWVVFRHKAGNV
jgi:putative flippase GtrA/glycosyltransferase involved in cell wall biosynthesis